MGTSVPIHSKSSPSNNDKNRNDGTYNTSRYHTPPSTHIKTIHHHHHNTTTDDNNKLCDDTTTTFTSTSIADDDASNKSCNTSDSPQELTALYTNNDDAAFEKTDRFKTTFESGCDHGYHQGRNDAYENVQDFCHDMIQDNNHNFEANECNDDDDDDDDDNGDDGHFDDENCSHDEGNYCNDDYDHDEGL